MPKASDNSSLANALSKMTSNLSKAGGDHADLVLELAGLAGDMQKAGAKPHQVLVQMAHKSIAAFCDGSTCKADVPDPERHDGQTMASMHKAHGCLTQVDGVMCAGGAEHPHSAETPGGTPTPAGEEEGQGASSSAKTVAAPAGESDALAKVQGELLAKSAENAELVKTVTAIVPMLTRLQERVEQIANTPMPPMAIVRGGTPTTKAADRSFGRLLSSCRMRRARARIPCPVKRPPSSVDHAGRLHESVDDGRPDEIGTAFAQVLGDRCRNIGLRDDVIYRFARVD
jgi:hypothetical protein